MAFGVPGFSFGVFTAIGDVLIAAAFADSANVHFRTAVFTIQQTGKRVNVTVSVGSFHWRVCKYALYVFKGGAVDNRLMHILDYLPLAFINIAGMLIPVMLGGFEIDYIAAILLSCKDFGQGSLVPVGLDIVGKTLDPEITLARQMRCHYAAICALSDDVKIRQMYTRNPVESRSIGNEYIKSGRECMSKIIEEMLVSNDISSSKECFCEYDMVNEVNFLLEQIGKFDHFEIMLDLPYPRKKNRLKLICDEYVKKDQLIKVYKDTEANKDKKYRITLDETHHKMRINDMLYVGDGEGMIQICDIEFDKYITFKVINDFELCNNKAISFSNLIYSEPDDKFLLLLKKWIDGWNIRYITLSFVEDDTDISCLNKVFGELQNVKIIAKIENSNGITNINKILNCFDGCMVARGDLALNYSAKNLLHAQNKLVKVSKEKGKMVLVATDILNTLSYQNFPSRGEIIDINNILNQDFDGIILKSSFFF